MKGDTSYLGNPHLKRINVPVSFTEEMSEEYIKCLKNEIYFARTYVKVKSLDYGVVPFDMWPFQERLLKSFKNRRYTICKMPRQSGKSTTCISFLLHYLIFNPKVNIGILANKASTAREILERLQMAYELLPSWMQHGVVSWNKGSLELENGSKVLAESTSASAIRGFTFNIVFLDEFAFVQNNIADQFFSAVYPTISSGKSSKVIIVSTPHGMNHFYRMWEDAVKKRNEFNPIEVHWSDVPGRDESWKEATLKNIGEDQFRVEFECEFIGSIDTLISPSALRALEYKPPIETNDRLDVYEEPKEDHSYVITVDVSRGVGKDYSAFVVFDTTQFPYRVVAKFRDNEIKPMVLPNLVEKVARSYNLAQVLIEVNDIGDQVANILHYDLEYPNILMCAMRGRAGQQMGAGFSGSKTQLGVKMSVATKKLGCSNLKALIEEKKLICEDFDTIGELTTFVQRNNSFSAEDGCNDDLAMCLVIFSWAVEQPFFREMMDQDVRKQIYNERENQLEQDMSPFGFIIEGGNRGESVGDRVKAKNGELWELAGEYGDTSYMWDYI